MSSKSVKGMKKRPSSSAPKTGKGSAPKEILNEELQMGAEASTSAPVKKFKRRTRGGKKDGKKKAQARAMSEMRKVTSSAYASRKLRFKELTRQIIQHKRRKKARQAVIEQPSDVAGTSGT
ncbi:hypothetical protein GPALN_003052 [Globodera pallida]|nr:hypothetical protein GPALN_003052 [Globodera pallida]